MEPIDCKFCHFTFSSKTSSALHFVREHIFNKHRRVFTCPLCYYSCANMIDHMRLKHPDHCLYCAEEEKITGEEHTECKKLWDRAMTIYVDNDFVNDWIN